MLAPILSLAMMIGAGSPAAAAADREVHYFGVGAQPARAYLDAHWAVHLPPPPENDLTAVAAHIEVQKIVSAFEHWALGYVSSRVAMNDRLAPIQASLNWGTPTKGPEFMKKLGTMSPADQDRAVEAFLEQLYHQAADDVDAPFGDAAIRTGHWLINSYLPKACGGALTKP